MSPQDVPAIFADFQHHGSLFTLFLHSPLTAMCYICNVGDVPIHHWERCQGYVDKFVTEASRLVTRCRVDDLGKARDYIGINSYCTKMSKQRIKFHWIFFLILFFFFWHLQIRLICNFSVTIFCERYYYDIFSVMSSCVFI